ncbi:ABC transporter permease [Scytonema sp. UIC 10036]|uniref:ABC transporter permease n=1 Tax=Scytonema sp. UIC 10036 TaxID=2304196 RepID=UPI0012DA7BBA|nr:ABC transporter permease [Scytonema sp. UIC 10036]MUG96336.1 ABC transporter permease [Scytonema sp. UIC 10036]
MPPKRNPSLFVQILDLFLMELTNWRWSWPTIILNSTVTPILGIVALGSFAQGTGQEAQVYILIGNLVMSLMFGNLGNVSSRFTYMRFAGTLDYYATLPIRREALILATVVSFFLLSLPSLLVSLGFGVFYLQLPLKFNPLVLLVIPLCVLPLSGVGAIIGTYVRTPEESGSLSLLFTMVMLFIGPVLIPASRLPEIVLLLGHLSPATYAADALRQTLLPTDITQKLLIDIVVLLGFSLFTFYLVGRKVNWRQQ